MIRFLLTICFSLLSFGFSAIAQSASNSMKGAKVIRQKELDKKAIDLRLEIDRSKPKTENGRKPYTPKEKFEHMLQKNPRLKDLKDRLKMELDY